ncbi:MAG: superoxide dismutase family protein [Hyphomonadaceae bacterium]
MRPLIGLCAALFLAAACASAPEPPMGTSRTAWIVGRDGRALGQATFREGPTGVLIRVESSEGGRLPPGWHGLHLHTRGDCSDFANGFQAAGGHLTLDEDIEHGLMNANGPEAGDLTNLYVAPNGAFGAELFSPYVSMGPTTDRDRAQLLDADGAALMIHAEPDDLVSQPVGNAGGRLACAALTQLP